MVESVANHGVERVYTFELLEVRMVQERHSQLKDGTGSALDAMVLLTVDATYYNRNSKTLADAL